MASQLSVLASEARTAFEAAFASGKEKYTEVQGYREYVSLMETSDRKSRALAEHCRAQHTSDAETLWTELSGELELHSRELLDQFFAGGEVTAETLFVAISRGIDLKLLGQAVNRGLQTSRFGLVMAEYRNMRDVNEALAYALHHVGLIDWRIEPLLDRISLAR